MEAEDMKKIRKRMANGLVLSDPKGLADHYKAQREERLRKHGIAQLKKSLKSDEWDPTKFQSIEKQQALRDYWDGIIADSPNRTCISCQRLFFSYQSQVRSPDHCGHCPHCLQSRMF